mmetsp:Transcript_15243/g.48053  ORF Transcript_15243/g.48053 Transcript_15243/m.48053 type:complete len:403 (-) Transcript_15243:45-1253(-)
MRWGGLGLLLAAACLAGCPAGGAALRAAGPANSTQKKPERKAQREPHRAKEGARSRPPRAGHAKEELRRALQAAGGWKATGGGRPTMGLAAGEGLGAFGNRAGLANQVFTFLSLVRYAKQYGFDIAAATLLWRADWKTEVDVPHRLIWDVDHWNADEELPKLSVNATPNVYFTVPGLWQGVLNDGSGISSQSKRGFDPVLIRGLLRLQPVPPLRDVIDRFTPDGAFGALHARVESDLSRMPDMLKKHSSLPEIYSKMGRSRALLAVPGERRRALFVAVGEDVDDETRAFLSDQRSGPWKGTLTRRAGLHAAQSEPAAASFQYLAASIVDFQICCRADWFVGSGMSTFSNMVTMVRFARNKTANYYYNQQVLARRCDDGRYGQELMNGEFNFSQAGWSCGQAT